jgi:hypothetical protein
VALADVDLGLKTKLGRCVRATGVKADGTVETRAREMKASHARLCDRTGRRDHTRRGGAG